MQFLKKTWSVIKRVIFNKYLLVLLVFGVYVTFFDQHSFLQRWESNRKLKQLEKDYNYYQDLIKKDKEELYRLQHDDKYLEKFAREHYHMKKSDEEIYIIKD
ncbi:MAG: Septum formation initiator [Bacteroidetes bacterium]|jgi:cell division protein FtsB|nr:Septum formation initiator [Bacteroidota bacterium]